MSERVLSTKSAGALASLLRVCSKQLRAAPTRSKLLGAAISTSTKDAKRREQCYRGFEQVGRGSMHHKAELLEPGKVSDDDREHIDSHEGRMVATTMSMSMTMCTGRTHIYKTACLLSVQAPICVSAHTLVVIRSVCSLAYCSLGAHCGHAPSVIARSAGDVRHERMLCLCPIIETLEMRAACYGRYAGLISVWFNTCDAVQRVSCTSCKRENPPIFFV